MRIYTREIITDKAITIAELSDAHYGSVACDKELLKAIIDTIELFGWYFLTLGDMVEAIPHTDKRFDKMAYDWEMFTQKDDYNDLFIYKDHLVEMFWCIKDRCLGWAKGNHDGKGVFDGLVAKVTEELKTLYLGWTYHLRIRFIHPTGKYPPKLFVKMGEHGYSSARSAGGLYSPLVRRLGEFPDVDLLTWAHSHRVHMYPQPIIGASKNVDKEFDDKYCSRRRWAVILPSICDSYKRDIELWAETKQYPPADKGLMIYDIDPWAKSDHVMVTPRLAIAKTASETIETENIPQTAFTRKVKCPICDNDLIEADLRFCGYCNKVMCPICIKDHDCKKKKD